MDVSKAVPAKEPDEQVLRILEERIDPARLMT